MLVIADMSIMDLGFALVANFCAPCSANWKIPIHLPLWNMFLYTGFQSHYNVVSDFDLETPFKDDLLFSPHLGLSMGPGPSRLVAEVKWIQPWVDNTIHDPAIWNPLMETGTFGGFLSFYHNF